MQTPVCSLSVPGSGHKAAKAPHRGDLMGAKLPDSHWNSESEHSRGGGRSHLAFVIQNSRSPTEPWQAIPPNWPKTSTPRERLCGSQSYMPRMQDAFAGRRNASRSQVSGLWMMSLQVLVRSSQLLRGFRGLTLVLVQGSQELHGAQRPQTQSTAGGSGNSTPLK